MVGLIADLRREEQGVTVDGAPILATLSLALSEPACAVLVAESGGAVVGFIVKALR